MSARGCSIKGCMGTHHSRGYCSSHYGRWMRYGDPMAGGPTRIVGNNAARFWSKVDKSGPLPTWAPFLGPCWVWIGGTDRAGYGQFRLAGDVHIGAHRFAFEHHKNRIPHGLVLDHLCRTPSCVNPAHLEPVTSAENVRRGALAVSRCPRGHIYNAANTYIRPSSGSRVCRKCNAMGTMGRRIFDGRG